MPCIAVLPADRSIRPEVALQGIPVDEPLAALAPTGKRNNEVMYT